MVKLFTADDVVFYINDIIRNKTLHKEVPNRWKVAGKAVEIEKIDEQTFKFIFAAPYPGFLHMLGASGSYFSPYAVKHFLKIITLIIIQMQTNLPRKPGLTIGSPILVFLQQMEGCGHSH